MNELVNLEVRIKEYSLAEDWQERETCAIKIKCEYINVLRKYKRRKDKLVLIEATRIYDQWTFERSYKNERN